MKSSLFYTIVLASIAAVCAAPAPGATDVNALGNSQSSQAIAVEQGSTVRHDSPTRQDSTTRQDSPSRQDSSTRQNSVTNQDSVTNQVSVTTNSSPAVKQETKQESSDEGYTTFLITSPSKDDTYAKGSTATIQWINGIEGPFTINVLTGKSAASMQRTNVSLKADGTAGYYDWVVAKYLSAGTYSFQFVYNVNGERQVTYSEQFRITSA